MPSAFPPPCLISISVFGMSGMMRCTGRAGGTGGWTDRSIDSLASGFIYGSLGRCFGTLGGHFGVDFGIIFVVLVGAWATLSSPGVPKAGRVEKVTEKVVPGSFVSSPATPFAAQNRQKI